MRPLLLLCVLAVAVTLAAAAAAQPGVRGGRSGPRAQHGQCTGDEAQGAISCSASIGAERCTVGPTGRATCTRGGRTTRRVQLPMYASDLSDLWFVSRPDGPVLLYAVSDSESESLVAARLGRRGPAPAWVLPVAGFNVVEPIVAGSVLYIASVQRVAAVDMTRGRMLWETETPFDTPDAARLRTAVLGSVIEVTGTRTHLGPRVSLCYAVTSGGAVACP